MSFAFYTISFALIVGVTLGNVEPSSLFTQCKNGDIVDVICNYAKCTYAKGQSLQQNKYISLGDIRNSQPPGYLLKLQLFIRGDKDCHIVLSPNDTNSAGGSNYDIVIGGFNNNNTYVKKTNIMSLKASVGVLPLIEPAEFHIQLSRQGELEIYKGDDLLLRTIDRQPLQIKFIKFGSFERANLEYFYDCPNNDNGSEAVYIKNHGEIADSMTSKDRILVHTASMFNRAHATFENRIYVLIALCTILVSRSFVDF